MKDRITISDVKKRNEQRINALADRCRMPIYDRKFLMDMNNDAYDRLTNASAVGLIYQEMLLDVYSEAEIKEKLKEHLLKIDKETIYL